MVNYREGVAGAVNIGYVHEESIMVSEIRRSRIGYRAVKRAFDIAASFTALLLLAVPMLIIAAVIAIDSPGKPVFSQNRVGRGGKLFRIYKFRTMVTTAPNEMPTCMLDQPYSYITRVGEFLRKTSLDELPQLFNVLRGDMSIVGPRPLIAVESEIHDLRKQQGVYDVRPGVTGWAQVNGRDNLTTEEKVRYDAEYVEKRSIAFDIKVLWQTVAVVLKKEGYSEGSGKQTSAVAECESEESLRENSKVA